MGFLDKIMFWKKEDDFDALGKNPMPDPFGGKEYGMGNEMQFPTDSSTGYDHPYDTGMSQSYGQNGMPAYGQNGMYGYGQGTAQSLPNPTPSQPKMQPDDFSRQRFPGQQQYSPSYTSYQPPQMQQNMESKNMEIISSKLDALRASIESLNQRLANIEAMARNDDERKRGRYY